jgi:hypothetical protein
MIWGLSNGIQISDNPPTRTKNIFFSFSFSLTAAWRSGTVRSLDHRIGFRNFHTSFFGLVFVFRDLHSVISPAYSVSTFSQIDLSLFKKTKQEVGYVLFVILLQLPSRGRYRARLHVISFKRVPESVCRVSFVCTLTIVLHTVSC